MREQNFAREVQVTSQPRGHILTNANVWSPDGEWIVYDTRSDPAGEIFDGTTIEIVHVPTGEVRTVYESRNGAHCGVATFHPREKQVIFIHGPEHPAPDWQYAPQHRQGVIVDLGRPGETRPLDARDLLPPFTPGALRGGTHLHLFCDEGDWVVSTYEDHVLAQLDATDTSGSHEPNQRNIAVSAPIQPVKVPKSHPRNHDGDYFTVVVTNTVRTPRPGTDEIARASEEAWIGTSGYRCTNGDWQRRAIAFQGEVVSASGATIREVFLVDLPDDLTRAGNAPLQGTATTKPNPPRGVQQRRLTFTADRRHPGIQGPRHWLRSSPDGERIAFLMRDDSGTVQLWTVSPRGGEPLQITHDPWSIASAFSWSPDGRWIAYHADGSVFIASAGSGESRRLTPKDLLTPPRPEACVFSPDGKSIAYVRHTESPSGRHNQVFIAHVDL